MSCIYIVLLCSAYVQATKTSHFSLAKKHIPHKSCLLCSVCRASTDIPSYCSWEVRVDLALELDISLDLFVSLRIEFTTLKLLMPPPCSMGTVALEESRVRCCQILCWEPKQTDIFCKLWLQGELFQFLWEPHFPVWNSSVEYTS